MKEGQGVVSIIKQRNADVTANMQAKEKAEDVCPAHESLRAGVQCSLGNQEIILEQIVSGNGNGNSKDKVTFSLGKAKLVGNGADIVKILIILAILYIVASGHGVLPKSLSIVKSANTCAVHDTVGVASAGAADHD